MIEPGGGEEAYVAPRERLVSDASARLSSSFDGPSYDAKRDRERLQRQLRAVWFVMRDCQWHSLAEIGARVGAPTASVSARVRDLRKDKFGAHVIVKRRRAASSEWEYRLLPRVSGSRALEEAQA